MENKQSIFWIIGAIIAPIIALIVTGIILFAIIVPELDLDDTHNETPASVEDAEHGDEEHSEDSDDGHADADDIDNSVEDSETNGADTNTTNDAEEETEDPASETETTE